MHAISLFGSFSLSQKVLMNTDTLFTFHIADILKDSNYSLTQFEDHEIEAFNESIVVREIKGKPVPYVKCIVRQKEIKLTPEEIVRQLFVRMLIQRYQYPVKRMALEVPVNFGREIKRADIVVFDKDRPMVPYIMVEIKKPKLKDGKEQLRSYCNATGSPMGVWSNGGSISYYHRIEQVLIPIIDMEKQEKITRLIQQSFQLKKQSQQLLEAAKQAVEIAIEQGEDKAMGYIQTFWV